MAQKTFHVVYCWVLGDHGDELSIDSVELFTTMKKAREWAIAQAKKSTESYEFVDGEPSVIDVTLDGVSVDGFEFWTFSKSTLDPRK